MQNLRVYSEEELLKLYSPFIKAKIVEFGVGRLFLSQNSEDLSADDIWQEACLGFINGLRVNNSTSYPLDEYTLGVCSLCIQSQLSRNVFHYRRGIRYPRKKRMAKGTCYIQHEPISDAENSKILSGKDVELMFSFECLSTEQKEIANDLMVGLSKESVQKKHKITRYALEHILDEIADKLDLNRRKA